MDLTEGLGLTPADETETLQAKIESDVGQLEREIQGVRNATSDIRYFLSKAETKQWEQEGVLVNALRNAGEMLRWALETGNQFHVADALDKMLDTLHKGASLDASDMASMDQRLRHVPEELQGTATLVREA